MEEQTAPLWTEEDASALQALRVPFPAEVIGLLPKGTKRNVADSEKKTCQECGAWMGPHIHLSYVGHSAVTDRLLTHDLRWEWAPLATDIDGLPIYRDASGGAEVELWIKLTVRGVTRLGVGIVEKSRTDLGKQLISDAIKNAAMRFGVALDLWTKDELESLVGQESTTTRRKPPKSSTSSIERPSVQRDPDTEGRTPFDSKLRNKVVGHFAKLDPPVRGNEAVAVKIQVLLGLDELVPLAKLDAEQGAKLMELLGVEP